MSTACGELALAGDCICRGVGAEGIRESISQTLGLSLLARASGHGLHPPEFGHLHAIHWNSSSQSGREPVRETVRETTGYQWLDISGWDPVPGIQYLESSDLGSSDLGPRHAETSSGALTVLPFHPGAYLVASSAAERIAA